ncbi:MAG: acetoin utilization deacetylase AcuC-like enzyme [Marivirga sp.]|jgi:acetoin utilization deacetylase AcuC-like enzyme
MLKIAWRPEFIHPLPEKHRFPMEKYDLIPEQLLYEGTILSSNLFAPAEMSEDIILSTHDPLYWEKLKNLQLTKQEERKTGFPQSKELVKRERIINQGTIDAALFAFEFGVAMNIAGGTHHAFTNRGEGFCLLNDIAIAAKYLLNNGLANKILVVDLDVHQGNGTAEIFKNEKNVYTFSMHGGHNYPLHKEKSDLDIPLADGCDDKEYLRLLYTTLPKIVDEFQPDFIFYQAGVDVLSTDKLGRLGMSRAGCKMRDKYVLEVAHKNNIPVTVVMGGGYSEKITHIIDAHANTFRLAQEIYF